MTSQRPAGYTAVMAERRDPTDALDFFPTPPWATRALCAHVLRPDFLRICTAWEPAAGEGHMAEVLREYFGRVHASDVHDYGCNYGVGSFVGEGADRAHSPFEERGADWIIANPPFNLGIEFARRAIEEARHGVALLLRTAWLESVERYKLFSKIPPTAVAVFVERVPMTKGRWDPDASTATSYVWFVWQRPYRCAGEDAALRWIPPGRRAALTRQNDIARFDTLITRAGQIECGHTWTRGDGWQTYLHTGNALINMPSAAMRKIGERYRDRPDVPDRARELAAAMIDCANAATAKHEGGLIPNGAVVHVPHWCKGEFAHQHNGGQR